MASAWSPQALSAKWRAWSLPSKITVMGTALSAISLLLTIFLALWTSLPQANTSQPPPAKEILQYSSGNNNVQVQGENNSINVTGR